MLKSDSITDNLPPLPKQPSNVSWPTQRWPQGQLKNAEIAPLANQCFELTKQQGVTYALLVIQGGEIVFERYDAGADFFYLQYSWSMAKSITHALAGILVKQGKLDIYAPANVPEWRDDARADITVDQLLRMSSGLKFNEDYVDGQASDVIAMLNTHGRHDTGAFAANMPGLHPPGSEWLYSSGTTNIICRILRDIIGNGANGMLQFMRDELFEPLGMHSATPKFDSANTFIGSSFLFATAQDFARFGLLYLRNGLWQDQQILPDGWVDYARSPIYNDGEFCYGAHWWMHPQNTQWFYCSGYDGQRIMCLPKQDAIIVRLGRTPLEQSAYVWDRVNKIAELL